MRQNNAYQTENATMSFMDRINAIKADAPVDEAKKPKPAPKKTGGQPGNKNNSQPALRAVFAKAFSMGKRKAGTSDKRVAKRKTGVAKAGETYSDAEYFKNFRKEYADIYNPELKLDAGRAADSSIRRQGKKEESAERSFRARVMGLLENTSAN